MIDLLPTFAGIAWNPGIRGILIVVVGVVVLCGSVYLLLATNMGARLGLLVALAGLFGWMVILTFVYWIAPPAIGPRGMNPSWQPVEIFVEGSGAARTTVLDGLPAPGDLPTPNEVLDQNPGLDEEFPRGFVLSDLVVSHPEVLDDALRDVDKGGWSLVDPSMAGEAQTVADTVLVEEGIFAAPTDFRKLDTWTYGGVPTRLEACPDAVGGGVLPDDPLCRLRYELTDTLRIQHPPQYMVVQVQQVIPQEPRVGEAPPRPRVDPTAPVISVVMVRDLGTVRLIPFIYFVISLSLFVLFVLILHYRDKTLKRNLEEASAQGA